MKAFVCRTSKFALQVCD